MKNNCKNGYKRPQRPFKTTQSQLQVFRSCLDTFQIQIPQFVQKGHMHLLLLLLLQQRVLRLFEVVKYLIFKMVVKVPTACLTSTNVKLQSVIIFNVYKQQDVLSLNCSKEHLATLIRYFLLWKFETRVVFCFCFCFVFCFFFISTQLSI